jgi:DNA polymerase III subunit delta
MSDDDLQPAYLIVGSDRPKVARALERLRARVGAEAVETLSARETSGEEAVAALNALGLFGGLRLVLVEEAERWKAADAKAIAGYLQAPVPDTVLAVTGAVKADSALGKAIAKAGRVLAFDVVKKQLPNWVLQQFERRGAEADQEAARALVELVGDDVDALAAEVDKLATWASGEPIGAADVEVIAAGRAETAIFALTDAWGRRDLSAALAASEAILERSDRPRRDEVPRLSATLAAHVGRVRKAHALAARGVRARDAVAELGVRHPFAAEKAFAHARVYSEDELRRASVRLAELDHALKGGSRLAADLELQRALVDVTQPSDQPTTSE